MSDYSGLVRLLQQYQCAVTRGFCLQWRGLAVEYAKSEIGRRRL